MIYSPLSFSTRSNGFALASGASLTSNGQAMVAIIQNGRQVVQPSSGVAGEVFVGFSAVQTSAAPFIPATAVKVEEMTVPASGVVTLAKNPLAASVAVVRTDTGAAVAVVTVTGADVDLAIASANLPVRVTYRYNLTALEAQTLVGSIQPGGFVGNLHEAVSITQAGIIYTSVFNSADNWSVTTGIRLGANGMLTTTGAGTIIPATIKQVANVSYPYLGVQFDAAV